MDTLRQIGAVVAGVLVWGVLWNLGTSLSQSLFPEATAEIPISGLALLLGYLAYGFALSVLAGWIAASIVVGDPMPTVWALALVQLAIGIFVQYSFSTLFPLWYHVAFLALVIPGHVYGGRLKTGDV